MVDSVCYHGVHDKATIQNPKDYIHRPAHCRHERVVSVGNRETIKVAAEAMHRTDARMLTDSVHVWTEPATVVRTDEAPSDDRFNRPHQSIKHSIGEYVRGMAYTNGIESFLAMLKRANLGVLHRFSFKHLRPCVAEASGRQNIHPLHTAEQLRATVSSAFANRLPYAGVIRPKCITPASVDQELGVITCWLLTQPID